MLINTKFFDEVEIDEKSVLQFKDGIFGFESEKEFVVLNLFQMEDFACLQSITEENVAFVLVKPWKFYPDYDALIPNEELKDIFVKDEKQVALYNIVTITDEVKNATANLLAPIVINIDKMQGKQYVLREDIYHTRHQIFNQEKV